MFDQYRTPRRDAALGWPTVRFAVPRWVRYVPQIWAVSPWRSMTVVVATILAAVIPNAMVLAAGRVVGHATDAVRAGTGSEEWAAVSSHGS